MIPQCEIRKLYAQKADPVASAAIDVAKSFERLRCGHHPDKYPEPLETRECMAQVVDRKDTGQNKHRYVVATQKQDVRRMLRGVRGVPLIYIKRSVMILEPMADETAQQRAREERRKFRAEIKTALGKRKREAQSDEEGHEANSLPPQAWEHADQQGADRRNMKKRRGPKGPNPLSVKKPQKNAREVPKRKGDLQGGEATSNGSGKRKRREKNKSGDALGEDGDDSGRAPASSALEE